MLSAENTTSCRIRQALFFISFCFIIFCRLLNPLGVANNIGLCILVYKIKITVLIDKIQIAFSVSKGLDLLQLFFLHIN